MASQPKKSVKKSQPSGGKPVPPDAVRVWRGFRLGSLMPADFVQALGTIFIPITAQLQRLYGLTAYLPTVLPTDKPAGLPDEIALVFYETQQAYTDTSKIVAGRAYSSLHKTVFAFPASQSGFPTLFSSSAALDQPYHLFKQSVDWREGYAQVFVGARRPETDPKKFAVQLQSFFQAQQGRPPRCFDGAIFCISANWVVYWEHWQSEAASQGGAIAELPKIAQRVVLQAFTPLPVTPDLAAHDPGFSRNQIDSKSLNINFPR
jgi:hypothetical protein